jgi:hypothetical protein
MAYVLILSIITSHGAVTTQRQIASPVSAHLEAAAFL